MGQVVEGIAVASMGVTAAGITLWAAGAIYYDICRRNQWARWLALLWVLGVVALFALWQPLWQPFVALVALTGLFFVWWFRQKASHQRDWHPSVAVLPRCVREQDTIRIENVR